MDVLDSASCLEAKQTEMALARHRASTQIPAFQKSALRCVACDQKIPRARQEASLGCQYCIDCQVLIEKGK